VISDSAPITARSGCTLNGQGDAECPISVDAISMVLRDGNDTVQYRAPHGGGVTGEAGDDVFFGALRQALSGRSIQPVSYVGAGVGTRSTTRSPTTASGQELHAEVEATDTRGARQLEHDAGTVRVAE
jgi:hypothetical protein